MCVCLWNGANEVRLYLELRSISMPSTHTESINTDGLPEAVFHNETVN